MGTRSITVLKDEDGRRIANIYRQFDGYLAGHGKDLKRILGGARLINGFSGQKIPEHFNGMGCLGAWLVGALKDNSIGGIYLTDSEEESYVYTLSPASRINGDTQIKLHVKSYDKVLYDGLLDDFDPEMPGSDDN